MKTKNTNFALLVSKNFTEPFKSPIEYGKHIAQLGNMLSDGKILLQRYGDFRRGRRTTAEKITEKQYYTDIERMLCQEIYHWYSRIVSWSR